MPLPLLVVGLISTQVGLGWAGTLPPPVSCPSCWVPPVVTSWQIQLTGVVRQSVNAAMYEMGAIGWVYLHPESRHAVTPAGVVYRPIRSCQPVPRHVVRAPPGL